MGDMQFNRTPEEWEALVKKNKQITMAQQTVVSWLKKELEDFGDSTHLTITWEILDELCEQAKAMEKEQIIKSYKEGHFHLDYDTYNPEQYYNQTYNK